ncbi:MAG TPA: hypothetical protein VJ622_06185 [Acidimicrobiia bacterium]|nr:hypothetical protein [Acidimicrobiia bacterium]HKN89851.1 hypothetical protein [Acidimicrobiia bacterium]
MNLLPDPLDRPDETDEEFGFEEFFEPTIEESIMASGLHRQYGSEIG